jgi:multidrug resistance efflux pump
MIILITLCYLGCVFIAFKVIKIKVTAVSIAAASLAGVFILGGIIIAWNFSAPTTQKMTVTRHVVPILASQNTKELITKIHAKMDQPVKKGDLLFEVETAPFQYTVDQSTAWVEESRNNIQSLEAAMASAAAGVEKASAARAASKADFDAASGTKKRDAGAISELKYQEAQLSYESAKAAVNEALAAQKAAEFALASSRETLKISEAQLRTAQLELDRAYIKAPADGRMINWQAREGTMTTTVISSAQGTFEDTSWTRVVAVYRSNLLMNVAAGDDVEIAFKSYPNRIITGKVDAILEYTGEGQFITQGKLPVMGTVGSKGFLAVRIILDDEEFAKELPLGGAGMTAIYTKKGNPFHLITKVVVRMKSLLYNLPT